MSNRDIKIAKKKARVTRGKSEMIGEYATIEELVKAKEAELKKVIPELDIPVLLQRIGK